MYGCMAACIELHSNLHGDHGIHEKHFHNIYYSLRRSKVHEVYVLETCLNTNVDLRTISRQHINMI